MKKSRFIQILRTFSHEEFKLFGKFLRSPFFNTNKTIISFYIYLKKHYPVFSEKSLDEKKIYKLLYLNKPFNSKRIRDLSSEMFKLCENFLSNISFHKDKFYKDYFLRKELNPRNQQNIYKHYYSTLHTLLKSELTGYESFNKRTLLNKDNIKFYNSYNYDVAKSILPSVIYETFISSFFEILRGLSGIAHIVNDNSFSNFIHIINDINRILKKNNFFNEPLLEIYYHISIINSGINDKSYLRIKKLFYSNLHLYNDEIKKEIYSSLINYLLVYKNTNRDIQVTNEYHTLMAEMIKFNLIYDNNNYLFPDFFLNYILILLELNKINDAFDFFEKNKNNLKAQNKDDYIYFLKARILFSQNKFFETLAQLSKLTQNDVEFNFYSFVMKIICNYELNNYLESEKLSDSYVKMINRKKEQMSKLTYKDVYPFANYFNKFIKFTGDKLNLTKLKNKLITGNKFWRRQWLIQKIEESIKEL